METKTLTKVGVGSSENTDSHAAGREAAHAALQTGGLQSCGVVLLFSTSKHDPQALHAGVREVVGADARIVGGYAVGIITNQMLGYDGYQVGVAIIENAADFELFSASGLPDNEAAVGHDLGQAIACKYLQDDKARDFGVIVLYDWINRTEKRLKLNMATPLLESLHDHLPSEIELVGAGLVGDMQCRQTWQWFDDRIEQQTAMALVNSGDVKMDSIVLHGCRPSGNYHTVTAVDGAVILEIDNRPAVEVMAEMLGLESLEEWDEYRFFVTLGINKGDLWGDYREEDYINRLCLSLDKKRGGLVMFETGITPGTPVQLMQRSLDFEYMEQRTRGLLSQIEAAGRRPIFAFYIDCAGRAGSYCGSEEEDGCEMQRVLGEIPMLGIYSGIEIGRAAETWEALEWSGVLCIYSE